MSDRMLERELAELLGEGEPPELPDRLAAGRLWVAAAERRRPRVLAARSGRMAAGGWRLSVLEAGSSS